MLASGLASCTFSVIYSWATHAELSVDDLAIDVHWSFADDPHRVSDIDVELRLAVAPAEPHRGREARGRAVHRPRDADAPARIVIASMAGDASMPARTSTPMHAGARTA